MKFWQTFRNYGCKICLSVAAALLLALAAGCADISADLPEGDDDESGDPNADPIGGDNDDSGTSTDPEGDLKGDDTGSTNTDAGDPDDPAYNGSDDDDDDGQGGGNVPPDVNPGDPDDKPPCFSDRDCPQDMYCVNNLCEPINTDPPPIDDDCVCPEYYHAVCGDDGVTYDNECFAECAGVGIAYDGPCDEPGTGTCEPVACDMYCPNGFVVGPDGCEICECNPECRSDRECGPWEICVNGLCEDNSGCKPEPEICDGMDNDCDGEVDEECGDCVCPTIWAPVCGADGQTYGNKCEAECANVEIDYPGECQTNPTCEGVPCNLYCPNGYETDANGCEICECKKPNRCVSNSDCAADEACVGGVCVPTGPSCVCDGLYDPWCGSDGQQYGNACEAECNGAKPMYHGLCECMIECFMPDPVCADNGETYTCGRYEAECNGRKVLYPGECKSECEPVMCDLYCENGFEVGPDGCEICKCKE